MQSFRVVNMNAINEMALRFGWRTPVAKPTQPLKTLPWGKVVSRRETVIRGGVVISTSKFYSMFETTPKAIAFGGVTEEYERACRSLKLRGKWFVHSTHWNIYPQARVEMYTFDFNPYTGIWGITGEHVAIPTTEEPVYSRGTQGLTISKNRLEEFLRQRGVTRFASNNPIRAAEILASLEEAFGGLD